MTTITTKLLTLGKLLLNKGALILVGLVLMHAYLHQNGLPFAEVLYLITVAFAVFIAALVLRFLFFPEAAEFAEDKARWDAALAAGAFPHVMRQYRFATVICFAVPTAVAIAIF